MQVHFTLSGKKVAIRSYPEVYVPRENQHVRFNYNGYDTLFRVNRVVANYITNVIYVALEYKEIVRK